MAPPTIISLLVEGDLPGFGGSKQRVVIDTARVLIIDDLLPLMAPQLFNAETEEMISVQGENIALQYFDAMQRRYLPLEDLSQLRDKLKVKLVAISHSLHAGDTSQASGHPSPERKNNDTVLSSANVSALGNGPAHPDTSPERVRKEERAAVEVVGGIVAQLSQFAYGDAPLTPHNIDNVISAVRQKHGILRFDSSLVSELRSEIAAAYIVGKERQRPHPLEKEVNTEREAQTVLQNRITQLENANRDLDQSVSELRTENKRLNSEVQQLRDTLAAQPVTRVVNQLEPQALSETSVGTATETATPNRPSNTCATTPSMPPVPPPTPAGPLADGATGPLDTSLSFGGLPSPAMRPSVAREEESPAVTALPADVSPSQSAPVYTATYSGKSTAAPRRPQSAARTRPTPTPTTTSHPEPMLSAGAAAASLPAPNKDSVNPTPSTSRADPMKVVVSSEAHSGATHMVSCFYNHYDPARRMTVKMGKAVVLNGGSVGGYYGQLMAAVQTAFKRDDLSVGYTHSDGPSIIIDSEGALKEYLQLAARKGVSRPILQCFDSENGTLPPMPPSQYHSYPPPGSTDAGESSGSRPASALGSRPTSASPSRPHSAAQSRPGSAMGVRPMSAMSTTSSLPVESLSGSYLDDFEMRWQFGQVSKDNIHATKADVLKYIQLRYDDMGDAKRFHRLLAKFKKDTLSYDEFCIVLLRLAAG